MAGVRSKNEDEMRLGGEENMPLTGAEVVVVALLIALFIWLVYIGQTRH
jgi:hypothetical protein